MTDHRVASLLAPLAFWSLINGIDEVFVDLAGFAAYLKRRFSIDPRHHIPTEEELDAVPPRLMAIFVSAWKEHKVIQRMIENNATRLNYARFEFFVGAYPNDALTLEAIQEITKRYSNVHLALTPHDGPTSKADNLNWIYQRMLLHEQERGVRFDMVLIHDAEDLIDPDALRWINYYAQWNDMVQIPVLALPTPFRLLSHGVYCDEFAEFQFKDMPARQLLGGFIPSNGVGTGFSRRALEMLAETYSNRVFEPACLTEDYENGFRVRHLGLCQKFIPIHFRHGRPVATREFFPLCFSKAVRQRTRWIMGITLQSWRYHSTPETFRWLYWFWRDRRGLIGNLITPVANILFVWGVASWIGSRMTHETWALGHALSRFYLICAVSLSIQIFQTAIRAVCSARIYGWRFACGVPVRVIVANIMNCIATLRAIAIYTDAAIHCRPLRWVKTEHAYPNPTALMAGRMRLRDILIGSLWITPDQLEWALECKPPDRRLGEHLLLLGMITEEDLYTALSLQNNLPFGKPEPETVSVPVTRALPATVARSLRVLPFRIAGGELYVAGPELPGEQTHNAIRPFSSLDIRFHLVTPTDFEELADDYLN
jgi:adsorption protein B